MSFFFLSQSSLRPCEVTAPTRILPPSLVKNGVFFWVRGGGGFLRVASDSAAVPNFLEAGSDTRTRTSKVNLPLLSSHTTKMVGAARMRSTGIHMERYHLRRLEPTRVSILAQLFLHDFFFLAWFLLIGALCGL